MVTERQHTFRHIAVERDIDARHRDRPAPDIGLGLQREAAEPSARQRFHAHPLQRIAQRGRIRRQRPVDL